MFIHFNKALVNTTEIHSIQFNSLIDEGFIQVVLKNGAAYSVNGPEAFNIVMKLAPEALEGEQAKYHKHAWAVHNLIGHPLMQILSWLHLTKLGIKIHDATVPNPIIK